jgi:transcriptional regulator with XRE-family HTH domain
MQEPASWRELLGKIIADSHERQRIANELGVNPITLTRWVNNESKPRPQNLRQLLKTLPEHRALLVELIAEEFEGFSPAVVENEAEDLSQEIPSVFYSRVLRTRATTARVLRFPSICNLVLQQALVQLDPYRVGMAVIVVRCMPPSYENMIRSLRESIGRGTPPWKSELDQEAIFLGAESLAGYAISSGRIVVNQDLKEGLSLFPAYRGVWEESAAATPITFEGNIAGCLLVSSTQPNYFVPTRLNLVTSYADLIGLAFSPEEFYEPERINLGVVPPQDEQRSYLSQFRQRVIVSMMQAARESQPINLIEAEQLVWQQIEEELLQLPVGEAGQ